MKPESQLRKGDIGLENIWGNTCEMWDQFQSHIMRKGEI